MRKVATVNDYAGHSIEKGDTVTTLSGGLTGKVCDLAVETDSTAFVCIKPTHRPFSKGVWHAADRVQRTGGSRKKPA